MSSLLDRPLAFVDLETTGANATVDRITEIGIVTLDGGVSWEWSQLVNPEVSIPPFIEGLTGIGNEMVARAPTFAEIAPEVLERLEGHLFIAHNARFDYGFLKNEFKRLGIDFRAPVLCTVKLSRKLYPEHHHHNLDSLIARHGLAAGERHRALGDARAICEFWQLAHRELPAETVTGALKALLARPSLPSHLDADIVHELPEGHGVYLFYGENDILLYVGKSKTLRQRILAHFSGDHAADKEMRLSRQVRRIRWIECAGEVESLLTESHLVKTLQPTLNRQLRRNRECCAWHLADKGFGFRKPELVYARDLDLGRQDDLYGMFKSAKEAKEVLAEIARTQGLCLSFLGLEPVPPGKPCFARQLKRCQGACVGEESPEAHTQRLLEALGRLKLQTWPFPGPAVLEEGEVRHLIDRWCYFGAARSEAEMQALLAQGRPLFDRDTYRILVRHVERLVPLGEAGRTPRGPSASSKPRFGQP